MRPREALVSQRDPAAERRSSGGLAGHGAVPDLDGSGAAARICRPHRPPGRGDWVGLSVVSGTYPGGSAAGSIRLCA
ncbi:MAG: hypothetical protein AVDCRST_MAG49-980 [uncultured Thermomicrobiales bacterium]|uniref:Uncharacterized protein n=1 Tax=uncultured Thermomicrobiales bacterium TaxID=1645740 RepID=A0A6J4U9F1_9BACT|nr:MAG: hypothetical protein AVDCRST_MAG49-980 [uncultured Thermomicrobiales bacterium]